MDRVAALECPRVAGRRNRLLDTLDSASRHRLSPHLQAVKLGLGEVVCEAGAALSYAYFPAGSVLSLRAVLQNGSAIETANIGSEGAFGLFGVFSSRVSFVRCVIQWQGPLMRCPIDVLRNEAGRSKALGDLCGAYSESILTQVQQNMVCNAQHGTQERVCRWLLTMQDRAGGESLPYPFDFFAGILGENCEALALAAQSMQADGLVTYHRGSIQIVDRPGLEKASCECYGIIKTSGATPGFKAATRVAVATRDSLDDSP